MKAQSHREWYRNLGNDPFPLAFRNAPPWVFERMRRPLGKSAPGGLLGLIRRNTSFLASYGYSGPPCTVAHPEVCRKHPTLPAIGKCCAF